MAAPLSVSANPDTSVSDSCNCATCCPVSCCNPLRGRRVRKIQQKHLKPVRETRAGSDVEIHTETTLKVHGASQPVLNPDGSMHVEIDGKKYSIIEIK